MTAQNDDPIRDLLVHAGRVPSGNGRQVNPPIDLASTILFDTVEAFEAARDKRYEHGTVYYGRYGTPATFHLESIMAELEGAYGCSVVSSGVAAISLALSSLTKLGDHLLVADNVYGNTRAFCDQILTRNGVDVEYFDPLMGDKIDRLIRPETTTLMFEAPGSNTFEVPDIRAIASTARRRNVRTVIDSTWATPIFCNPLKLGVDVVVHSGSKYIGGHSDCMIGIVACNEATHLPIRKTVMAFGDKPGAQEVHLALRGLRTLDMRMRSVEAAGIQVASWLRGRPEVQKVFHPAFEDCPGHAFWRRDFTGSAGLFSVLFKTSDEGRINHFVEALQMFGIGVSWGGYESLALPTKPQRTAVPWREPGQLVRFNIGFENVASLIRDIERSLPLLLDKERYV